MAKAQKSLNVSVPHLNFLFIVILHGIFEIYFNGKRYISFILFFFLSIYREVQEKGHFIDI